MEQIKTEVMNNKPLTTPVLLLAFNRPELTKQVFEQIRKVRPSKLYVAVDAPRDGRSDDVQNCNKVKEIVNDVDWPCESHYLFQEKNLGCSKSGVTAWNWIFQHEERMIFVEDDGLGTPSAFYFIQEMLEKYKDDNRIAYVGAVNYGPTYGDKSYFFSRYPSATYFMGTWKRVQDLYEYRIESFAKTKRTKSYKESFISWVERVIANQNFKSYQKSIKCGRPQNTYDVQMSYLAYKYNMYSIYPNVNMVSNIGLQGGANNSVSTNSSFYKEYANRKTFVLGSIDYCEEVKVDLTFERAFFKKRVLYLSPWYLVYGKSIFLEYFGVFYRKYVRPIRRRSK